MFPTRQRTTRIPQATTKCETDRYVLTPGHIVAALVFGAVGCGFLNPFENLTADFEGRDVDLYAVDGDWLVYSWSPPNDRSRPLHLVVRNVATGAETELESDWYGRELAVSQGALAYETRSGGQSSLIVRDLASGTSTTLQSGGSVNDVELSGETVVWVTKNEANMNVITIAPTSGDHKRRIEDAGRTPTHSDFRPRLSGSNLVFLRRAPSTREYTMMHHDVGAGTIEPLPITTPEPISMDLSGDWVVYAYRNDDTIRAFNLQNRTEREIVKAPRRVDGPVVRGDKVAWISHVTEDEYTPVAGQPLIDERDFRSLHTTEMGSSHVATLVDNHFMVNQVYIDSYLNVYATMPRRITPGSADRIKDILRF